MENPIYANPFYQRTHLVPRPSRESHPNLIPQALAQQQREWDEAEQNRQTVANLRKKDKQRQADQQAAAAKVECERQEKRAAAVEAELKRAYLASNPGTTEADFERDKGELMRQHRIAQALDAAGSSELKSPLSARQILGG